MPGLYGVLVMYSPYPHTNMRGPIISPRLIKSRMAMSMYWSAPRSRTVVTPASSVRIAPLRARNTSTAGGLLVNCFSIGSPGVSSV